MGRPKTNQELFKAAASAEESGDHATVAAATFELGLDAAARGKPAPAVAWFIKCMTHAVQIGAQDIGMRASAEISRLANTGSEQVRREVLAVLHRAGMLEAMLDPKKP